MTKLRWTVCVALLVGALGVGCGSTGSVSGKLLADGAPLAGQTVMLSGPRASGTATTGSDGSYSFSGLQTTPYLLSVDVPATVERHRQVALDVQGAVKVPDLVFTGEGTISGTLVDASGAPLSGAKVYLLGTQLAASTDAQGAFTFTDAPTGAHTVSVTTADGHAEANVELGRGKVEQVALQVVANPPGTLSGSVTYFSASDASTITVSVPAAGVSAKANLDGSYSLQVPAGTWEVWASAKHFSDRKLGTVTVASGGEATLAPAELSLFTDLPTFGVVGGVWSFPNGTEISFSKREASLLVLSSPSTPSESYYAYDLKTGALRPLSVGNQAWLSHDGSKAIIQSAPTLLLVEDLAKGTQFSVTTSGQTVNVAFADDDSGAWVLDGSGPYEARVVRFDNQSATATQVYEFKSFGPNLLVRTTDVAPLNWSELSPQGVTPVFTDVTSVQINNDVTSSIAAAVSSCASAPCPVQVFSSAGAAARVAQGVTSTSAPSIDWVGGNYTLLSTDVGRFVVDLAQGTSSQLPADETSFAMNPDGTRARFLRNGGLALYESALPFPADASTLTPVLTSTASIKSGYLTSTRYVGFDDAPSSGAAYRFELNSGVLTEDSDYVSGSGESGGNTGEASWTTTEGGLRFTVGSGMIHDAPAGATAIAGALGVSINLSFTPAGLMLSYGTQAVVSFDGASTLIYDDSGNTPRLAWGIVNDESEFVPPFTVGLTAGDPTFLDIDTLQQFPLIEPGIDFSDVGLDQSLEDNNALLLLPRLVDGNPSGGAIALLDGLIAG